jgi:hypothetical protein
MANGTTRTYQATGKYPSLGAKKAPKAVKKTAPKVVKK